MRACWAATLLVLVQPSPASCATCRGTSVVPRVLAPAHRHLRKSPSVRQPFAEISGSISFSPLVFPFPETVPNFVCHFKGSLHYEAIFGPQHVGFMRGAFDSVFSSSSPCFPTPSQAPRIILDILYQDAIIW